MGKHSIIVIKNENGDYLQKFIDSWNCYLFLNCKVSDSNDIAVIKSFVCEELNVSNIEVEYVNKKFHKKFSEEDKIEKEYEHYFFKVNILENYRLKDGFKWFSMNELENDKRIMEVNSDIIGFIKEFNL